MADPTAYKVEDLVCNQSFQNYCLGFSQSEEDHWQQWERAHPELQEVVAKAKYLVNSLNARQGKRLEYISSLEDGLNRQMLFKSDLQNRDDSVSSALCDQEDHDVPGVDHALSKRKPLIVLRKLYKYAAILVILIAVGYVSYRLVYYKNSGTEYNTSTHMHKTILLPDSSVVVLNENSTLSVPNNFDATHRYVSIKGEGYFDIKHDAQHPFIVHTNAYKIKVLGTVFNVRSYPGETLTETALIRGKVEITRNDDKYISEKILLKPAQKYVLRIATKQQKSKPIQEATTTIDLKSGHVLQMALDNRTHTASETSWARKRIQIKDESLQDIAKRLESWYGVQIIINDPEVGQYRYTATFDDETILKVLNALQLSYPFHYSIQANTITIGNK